MTVTELKIAIIKAAAVIGIVPPHQRKPDDVKALNGLCKQLLDRTGECNIAGVWVKVQ